MKKASHQDVKGADARVMVGFPVTQIRAACDFPPHTFGKSISRRLRGVQAPAGRDFVGYKPRFRSPGWRRPAPDSAVPSEGTMGISAVSPEEVARLLGAAPQPPIQGGIAAENE